jgi:Pyruvate/2-oxoacid:ferredoxin oxidoreductase gamma subunit
LYPYVTHPDIMVILSQEAYVRFGSEVKEGGILIVEQDLVRVSDLSKSNPGLQHSRHPHRRRTRQAHGAEFRDGGILHRRHSQLLEPTPSAKP